MSFIGLSIGLVYNIALLFMLALIYVFIPYGKFEYRKAVKWVFGVLIGLIGIAIMINPTVIRPGIQFDARSIVLCTAGLFFGTVSTVIAAVMMATTRLLMGGQGAIAGVLVIITSSATGLIARLLIFEKLLKEKQKRPPKLIVFSIIVHLLYLVDLFVMPFDTAIYTFMQIALPLMTVFPAGTVVLSMILLYAMDVEETKNKLSVSESNYRMLYDSMSQGLVVLQSTTGHADNNLFIKGFNASFSKLFNLSKPKHLDARIDEVLPQINDSWIKTFNEIIPTCEPVHFDNYLEINQKFYSVHCFYPDSKHLAVLLTDVTDKKRTEDELRYLSYHDQLTGIYNRRYFDDAVSKLDTEENLPITIVMADLNGLKFVNDSLGHAVGDELLIAAAETISGECGEQDVVARTGGDEFAIILPHTNEVQAAAFVRRVEKAILTKRLKLAQLSISFGYDTKVKVEENFLEMLTNAEDYLYKHKVYESASMHSKTVEVIMNALFEKSHRELQHSKRVSTYCEMLANALKMERDDVNQIKTAGLLHDIGKIGIEESILNNKGGLTPHEWEEIKKHPESSWRILAASDEFSYLAEFVKEHHERWDGKGYPMGLKGEEITLEARIISLADAFDAMTSERTYKKAMSYKAAKKEIIKCKGTQFDPKLADLFITLI